MFYAKLSLAILLFAFAVSGQQPDVLATSTVRSFTVRDLTPESRAAWEGRRSEAALIRQLSDQMLRDMILDAEAKLRGTSALDLVMSAYAAVPDPPESTIKAVYDANKAEIGDRTPAEVRGMIVEHIRRQEKERALKALVDKLSPKFKVVKGRDAGSPDLKPSDVIFSVQDKKVTAGDLELRHAVILDELRADAIAQMNLDLEDTVLSVLIDAEARSLSVDASTVIAREITDKLREFSDEERSGLESALKDRLFTKYNVKFLFKEPEPVKQVISVDDDPFTGKASAPVTVVMFSDFQCPACARTHPALKRVIAGYGDKVRLVVRDFPLISIHDNAYRAALAANAAAQQGKFFEYSELLYENQDALDDRSLIGYAQRLGLNAKRFELDLASEKLAAEVRSDIEAGKSYGVSGTPSIFVNGVKIRRLSEKGFRDAINAALIN